MKLIKLLFILSISFGTFSEIIAQDKKTLDLETAIMQQYGDLYPESISQLQWMGDSDYYTYVKDNQLIRSNAKKKEKVMLTLGRTEW